MRVGVGVGERVRGRGRVRVRVRVRVRKLTLSVLETKGKVREARTLHSITLTSFSLASSCRLNGPEMLSSAAICRVIRLARRTWLGLGSGLGLGFGLGIGFGFGFGFGFALGPSRRRASARGG